MGWRQSNAFRLTRSRRERRNFGNLPMFQRRSLLRLGASILRHRTPPLLSRVLSRTSLLTMTSPLAFSAFVRISSALASPCQCLFSTKAAQRLCACWEEACNCRFTQFTQIFVLGEFSSMINDAERLWRGNSTSIDSTYCVLLLALFDDVEVDIAVALIVGEQLVHRVSRE